MLVNDPMIQMLNTMCKDKVVWYAESNSEGLLIHLRAETEENYTLTVSVSFTRFELATGDSPLMLVFEKLYPIVKEMKAQAVQAKPSPHSFGHSVVDTLQELFKLSVKLTCPECAATCPECTAVVPQGDSYAHKAHGPKPLYDVIMCLNDKHRWTREQVACWLEESDLDIGLKESA